MFRRLLIANRGEIARRIARTCRDMGVEIVAVYSDADADTPIVQEADLALRLGPPPARESYLDQEALLLLAEGNACDAIHPGYGFLSENADFSAACAARGIAFVGAPENAIRLMGDKAEAKRVMQDAGVPVLPGYTETDGSPEELEKEAERIGYPLLVKAVAGGGGRGIRRVDASSGLAEAVESARREAQSAFGDGRLMLEKYLPSPRHVEFQVMADTHGHAVHLFERECSVQRRHQKLIEEAPSPALNDALREAMGEAAVQAAHAIGYVGAGTVEFLLDSDGGFYFLEMNTRLQVEHPVTEMTLGLDLVRLQIEIAEGHRMLLNSAQLSPSGHAIECRLNAEDPARGFLPATGRIGRLRFPEGPGLRVDAGFAAGDRIGPHYDSLLAKLIVWGRTREEALRKCRRMLAGTFVSGVPTNLPFLQWVLDQPEFVTGEYSTHLVDDKGGGWAEEWAGQAPPSLQDEWIVAAAVLDAVRAENHPGGRASSSDSAKRAGQEPGTHQSPWSQAGAWTDGQAPAGRRLRQVTWDGTVHEVSYRHESGQIAVEAGQTTYRTRLIEQEPGLGMLDLGSLRLPIAWDWSERGTAGGEIWIGLRGRLAKLSVADAALAEIEGAGAGTLDALRAPLPGKVIQVAAAQGARVKTGDLLMVVEAMKMEHRITAPFAGSIDALHFGEGDRVDKGDLLLDLNPA